MVIKKAALSNMVPVHPLTCPVNAAELDAIGCTVSRKPTSALECCVYDAADGANVSGAKTASEYLADQQAESLGAAGISLLYSGSNLTAPPLIMLLM